MKRRRRGRSDPLQEYRERIDAIASLEKQCDGLSDIELQARAATLREALRDGASLEARVVEGFALVRESARRTLGQRLHDVQIACGLALHDGKIAEMQTGEGKTLAAVAPTFLHALSGKGAHLLTFNDYLARRDAAWMGPVYRGLGVSVAAIQEGMSLDERRDAYAADVTYLTAKESGFDLLRDGLCLDRPQQVQRAFHFALVDEADSILIDEARIPLVIAGAVAGRDPGLGRMAHLVRRLEHGVDHATDAHARNIFLTDAGARCVERELDCSSLFSIENAPLMAAIRNALHAEYLLRRDVDYLVRDGCVALVDELTGRVAQDRQWPDGLQAAVEAKEGVRLGADGRILGSITLQHLLRRYPTLSGMTATARPAADEFLETYGLEVAGIPSNRPCARRDAPDRVYTHRDARDRALIAEVSSAHRSGRPVLVGTASIADSERLSARLRDERVEARVLNAKHDEHEAAIIAEAGDVGAVTISTNMAGRGTDIRLGGRDELNRQRVVALGGLYVIGTHRHESRRIDDQLRGRAGRQGDPGSSRFFLSLDDDLLRRYGIDERIPAGMRPADRDAPIEVAPVHREIARSQRIAEGECSDIRRRIYGYAAVLEAQRIDVQAWRQSVLEGAAGPGAVERSDGERWNRSLDQVGIDVLREVERRLTLLSIDRCWAEYLTEMQALRDEIPLVSAAGREPLAEFYRIAIHSSDRLVERIDEEVRCAFERIEIDPDGVVWADPELQGPSATWTYLVNDNVFGNTMLMGLANRPGLGLWGVLAASWLLFGWGLFLHWRKRRQFTDLPRPHGTLPEDQR